MWDVEKSGEVERLLALASCNQQFLSHGLYAGVVRQLQVVDTGHYWGEEIIRVFWGLERLSHDRQRGIQAPETWDQPEASDRFSPDKFHILHIQGLRINSQLCLMSSPFNQGSCIKTLLCFTNVTPASTHRVSVFVRWLTSNRQPGAPCDKL